MGAAATMWFIIFIPLLVNLVYHNCIPYDLADVLIIITSSNMQSIYASARGVKSGGNFQVGIFLTYVSQCDPSYICVFSYF